MRKERPPVFVVRWLMRMRCLTLEGVQWPLTHTAKLIRQRILTLACEAGHAVALIQRQPCFPVVKPLGPLAVAAAVLSVGTWRSGGANPMYTHRCTNGSLDPSGTHAHYYKISLWNPCRRSHHSHTLLQLS